MDRIFSGLLLSVGLALLPAGAAARDFWSFETGPVRPLALSPDGTRLLAVNTPDARLEVFDVIPGGLAHVASVPVGLEPCAVALRTPDEAWVVNHLSDSVSVVALAGGAPRVVRTLRVGDEPRDIVFAGAGGSRAFVTTAARGQDHPAPADPMTPGIGRASVFVLDAASGAQLAVLTLFADTPRALAASPDGSKVYAAAFHSGNGTSVIGVPQLLSAGIGQLPPSENEQAPIASAPDVAQIVRDDAGTWRDALGGAIPPGVIPFTLPDRDVFEIDALATPPAVVAEHSGVGTILFNMVVHPDPLDGRVFVSNTDANNADRFEGFSTTWGNLRGELHRARISVLDGGAVLPRHLNKHLVALTEYAAEGNAAANADSLATPLEMAISADGETLYVAAFGSSKVGVFPVAALDDDSFVPDAATHIEVSGGGPGGLALDEAAGRLYVWTRFDNGISIVDLAAGAEIGKVPMHDAEPAVVRDGRPLLYDARFTSSNGEASCSACHVFADFDSLAWDLGVVEAPVENNPNPFEVAVGGSTSFHPLKGPMTTQTLRGMSNHGAMHWRGDRTDADDPATGGRSTDQGAFEQFNGAFEGLLGRTAPLLDTEMTAFAEFVLQIVSPPSPVAPLLADPDAVTASQQSGRDFFEGPISDFVRSCNGCHLLDASAGNFGGDGDSSVEGEPQEFKIPHMRNMYQKVGRFDVAGPQVRGFGFLHDGSVDTLLSFLRSPVFQFPGADPQRLEVVDFAMAFPAELAPVVGQQVTLDASNAVDVSGRIDLLIGRAAAPWVLKDEPGAHHCDLVVKGSVAGEMRGWVYDPDAALFMPDAAGDPAPGDAALRALATTAGQELTYTCVPPGAGTRAGIDRDADGELDADDSCPLDAPAGQPDPDGDGVGSICDSCPGEANADQTDSGGFGAGSLADGIGDACQCGDTSGDGVATASDVDQLRAHLSGAGNMPVPAHCNLVGVPGPGPVSCDAADLVSLRRRVAGAAVEGDPQICGS